MCVLRECHLVIGTQKVCWGHSCVIITVSTRMLPAVCDPLKNKIWIFGKTKGKRRNKSDVMAFQWPFIIVTGRHSQTSNHPSATAGARQRNTAKQPETKIGTYLKRRDRSQRLFLSTSVIFTFWYYFFFLHIYVCILYSLGSVRFFWKTPLLLIKKFSKTAILRSIITI